MIPDNVTLIVKAPNQQIDDQNIECLSSWTIGQLKTHLSEVYPNKPKKDEQKIIYSGQLLEDNTILKDILRMYESQVAYTIHLVCSPKRTTDKQKENHSNDAEGPRQRNLESAINNTNTELPRQEVSQDDQNRTAEMQNYMNYVRAQYPANVGNGYAPLADPASMAQQMAMMQQAYLHYYQHYANYMQMQAPQQTPAAPAPAPAAPPANDEEPIDWLDQVYAATRLALLTSLVYFYGSPVRFLLVLLVAITVYLHQIGYFRDLQVGNRRAGQGQREEGATETERDAENNRQSILAVTWTIFASFFASLVPETN